VNADGSSTAISIVAPDDWRPCTGGHSRTGGGPCAAFCAACHRRTHHRTLTCSASAGSASGERTSSNLDSGRDEAPPADVVAMADAVACMPGAERWCCPGGRCSTGGAGGGGANADGGGDGCAREDMLSVDDVLLARGRGDLILVSESTESMVNFDASQSIRGGCAP
jgi:hypothetical protein